MVPIPKKTLSPTVEAIYKTYVDAPNDWKRDHLGASLIGMECERAIWYTFRWCSKPSFDGRMLRLFDTGKREEIRLIKDLRKAGITIYSKDPDTGLQITYHSFGGHYGGSLDGMGLGFLEAPASWHVLEEKTASKKSFADLKKNGVQKWKPLYYAQVQAYMRWSEVDRTLFLCVCKDNDEIYEERIHYNAAFAKSLEQKAERIVFSDVPPIKINNDPESSDCKWCPHRETCQERRLPVVSCRACCFATPREDGKWICDKSGEVLSSSEQRHPCQNHIFIPDLVPMVQTDADPEKGLVTYGEIINGPGHIASVDLQNAIDGKSQKEREKGKTVCNE